MFECISLASSFDSLTGDVYWFSVCHPSILSSSRWLQSNVIQDWAWPDTITQTPLLPLTLTLLAAAASCQAGHAAWLTVVLHAGVEGGVDQTGFIWQEGHGGRSGAVIGQRGDGELWRAVSALAFLRASLPVCWEPIVRGPFTPAHMEKQKVAKS